MNTTDCIVVAKKQRRWHGLQPLNDLISNPYGHKRNPVADENPVTELRKPVLKMKSGQRRNPVTDETHPHPTKRIIRMKMNWIDDQKKFEFEVKFSSQIFRVIWRNTPKVRSLKPIHIRL